MTTRPRYCRRCAAPLAGTRYCNGCGASLIDPALPTRRAITHRPRRRGPLRRAIVRLRRVLRRSTPGRQVPRRVARRR